ncbi:MAG: DNA replication/repair protein RecF [Anaerolineales bacterium]
MHLKRLSLTNFRNFVRLEAELPPGPTLLIGANAQGKTSLLEAIYYLSGSSSPHSTSDRQLINFLSLEEPNSFARLVAEVQREQRLHRLEVRLMMNDEGNGRLQKQVLINGVKRRVSDLAEAFNAVMFLPQDLQIIEGSPGGRRRFLDQLISQADPLYSRTLTEYGKVLSQRNALLKQLQERGTAADQLDIWDEQLVEHGAALIRSRALALNEIQAIAQPIHEKLTRGRERYRLIYDPGFNPLDNTPKQAALDLDDPLDLSSVSEGQIEQRMLAALKEQRRDEIQRGVTRLGPHRDDLIFQATGLNLHLYGSRGQNRTAMLSTKIAEVKWLHQRTGHWPMLLLDEVLAELDANRRQDLLEYVLQVNQSILTAADIDMFTDTFCEQATLWEVRGGTLLSHPEGST